MNRNPIKHTKYVVSDSSVSVKWLGNGVTIEEGLIDETSNYGNLTCNDRFHLKVLFLHFSFLTISSLISVTSISFNREGLVHNRLPIYNYILTCWKSTVDKSSTFAKITTKHHIANNVFSFICFSYAKISRNLNKTK